MSKLFICYELYSYEKKCGNLMRLACQQNRETVSSQGYEYQSIGLDKSLSNHCSFQRKVKSSWWIQNVHTNLIKPCFKLQWGMLLWFSWKNSERANTLNPWRAVGFFVVWWKGSKSEEWRWSEYWMINNMQSCWKWAICVWACTWTVCPLRLWCNDTIYLMTNELHYWDRNTCLNSPGSQS